MVLIAMLALVAVSLLVGGIQCLRRAPRARTILLGACSVAMVYEIARTIRDALMQFQLIPLTLQHTQRILAGSGDQAADLISTVARVSMIVGVALGVLWLLMKLAFFGISVWYLRKPAVRAYLDGPDAAEPSTSGVPT